jgi:phage/plasmid-associated DNA primase
MKELAEVFYDPEFAQKADRDPMLLACANGVFDMRTLAFRAGKPEDYITKSTKVFYDPSKKWNEHENARDLWKFIEDVHPYEDVREYWLDLETKGLCGDNPQKLWTHTGSGANGKSMKDELMHSTLGDYDVRLPVTVFTQKRGKASGPNPELMKLLGARRASAEEPETGEPLNSGQLKELTGRITCRNLFDRNLIEFDIQAKIHIMCNKKPKADPDDGGLWRRIEVFSYPCKFLYPTELEQVLKNKDADPKLFKVRDESIKERLPTWWEPMLALLIQRYIERNGFKNVPIVPPKRVQEYTEEYKIANDGYSKFYKDCITDEIDPSQDHGMSVTKSELLMAFNDWKRSNVEFNGMNADGAVTYIAKLHGSHRPKVGWMGIRIRHPDE